MITGRKDRFAIEADLEEIVDGWVLGRIRFWLCGQAVGDWDDVADLKGCVGWLQDFASNPRDRHESSLERASPQEVFRRLYNPVMAGATYPPTVDGAFARFHISHLGMSSFENFDLLLLKDASGGERCVWRRSGSAAVNECLLWRNEMETVAAEFCELFEREMSKVE